MIMMTMMMMMSPLRGRDLIYWVPAFAGMTGGFVSHRHSRESGNPVNDRAQRVAHRRGHPAAICKPCARLIPSFRLIPAFAGMTP